MNLKILIFCCLILIFDLHCNGLPIKAEPLKQGQPARTKLKSPTVRNNYYVANTGNDNNVGSLSSPFQTIQKAAKVVNPGDSVIVRDGIYTATSAYIVGLSCSGTMANPIVFKSENKWGAKLDGSNNTTDSGWGFVFGNVDYVTLENFEIKNIGRMAIYIMEGSTNITIKGNYIHDIGRRCSNTDNGFVGVEACIVKNITISNNIFANIGRYSVGENGCSLSNHNYKNHDHAIYLDGVHGSMIINNIFYNNKSGWAIHLYSGRRLASSNISVLNNTFAFENANRRGHILLYGSTSNLLIANNIFYAPTILGINVHISRSITYANCVVKNNLTYGGVTIMGPEDDKGDIMRGIPSGFSISNNLDNTDPKMVSASTFNFALTAESPAINAGFDVELATDFSENARVGLPDIGAIEYIVLPTSNSSIKR